MAFLFQVEVTKDDVAEPAHRAIPSKIAAANSLLFTAIIKGDLEGVKYALSNGAEIEMRQREKFVESYPPLSFTPLLYAAWKGYEDVTKFLIEKGADIHALLNEDGNSLLDLAAGGGHANVIRLLLENGAKDEAKDGWALRSAVYGSHFDAAKVLIDAGASLEARDMVISRTTLMLAVIGDNKKSGIDLDIVKLLIESGADVNAKDKGGTSVLQLANQFLSYAKEASDHVYTEQLQQVIELLKQHGAE